MTEIKTFESATVTYKIRSLTEGRYNIEGQEWVSYSRGDTWLLTKEEKESKVEMRYQGITSKHKKADKKRTRRKNKDGWVGTFTKVADGWR